MMMWSSSRFHTENPVGYGQLIRLGSLCCLHSCPHGPHAMPTNVYTNNTSIQTNQMTAPIHRVQRLLQFWLYVVWPLAKLSRVVRLSVLFMCRFPPWVFIYGKVTLSNLGIT